MPSFHSPDSAEEQAPQINGLDQTPLDEFMPSSPDTEEFFQSSHRLIASILPMDRPETYYPLNETLHATTDPEAAELQSQRLTPSVHGPQLLTQPPADYHPARRSLGGGTHDHNGLTPSSSSPSGPISPSLGYISEAAYTDISENTTPGFEDVFSRLRPALGTDGENRQRLGSVVKPLDPNPLSFRSPNTELLSSVPVLSGTKPSSPQPHPSTYLLSPVNTENQREGTNLGPTSVGTEPRRDEDGVWLSTTSTGLAGLGPDARQQLDEMHVPSLNEQEANRRIGEKNVEVEHWLVRSVSPSVPSGPSDHRSSALRPPRAGGRRRARSTGDALAPTGRRLDDSHIPGPGVLIDEQSDDDEDDDHDDSSHRSDEHGSHAESRASDDLDPTGDPSHTYFMPTVNWESNELPGLGGRPWADPIYETEISPDQTQPDSSSAAMMRFRQAADALDPISRAATWGTRRLSETDLEKFLAAESFQSFSISGGVGNERGTSDRRNNFSIEGVKRLLPGGAGGLLRRKSTDKGSRLAMPRSRPSFSRRPKSPSINTQSAVAAMAGQIGAVGSSSSLSARPTISPISPTIGWRNPMKRSRSKTDASRRRGSDEVRESALGGLLTQEGGPPMPTLASPPQDRPDPMAVARGHEEDQGGEDEEVNAKGDPADERGIIMDLTRISTLIVPTVQGFQAHAQQLNPRCAPFLVDRIGHEQVRRFKKLIDLKTKHLAAVRRGQCPAGAYCLDLGGQAQQLPPRPSARGTEAAVVGFQVEAESPNGDGTGAPTDSAEAQAQFPAGVPLPPVKRLPAEFECQLCFQVKKFLKPSDWTKHVLEDVQPFTCTFPNCAEPKSFKRKADWVRHETERHRQLEWWTCRLPDCTHTCYRRDNFVQHLVREHKRPESRLKAAKLASKQAARAADGHDVSLADADDADDDWALVEQCRTETSKSARDEPCKFCGNVCGSWKKLTVHLARHMEQLSLPILDLVAQHGPPGVAMMSTGDAERLTSTAPFAPSGHSPGLSYGAVGDDAHLSPYAMPLSTYASPVAPSEINGTFAAFQDPRSVGSLSPGYHASLPSDHGTLVSAPGAGQAPYGGYESTGEYLPSSSVPHFAPPMGPTSGTLNEQMMGFAGPGLSPYGYDADVDEAHEGMGVTTTQPAASGVSFSSIGETYVPYSMQYHQPGPP
ncbi:MAG: hypothetical protein M1838_000068 [Thelocarpon superellum]|nr:MAG: hypothetical protein M1838_000068 [Thelocarpon superellum]